MITIKTEKEIEVMAEGGHVLGCILQELAAGVKPGVVTRELDRMAHEKIIAAGSKPAFLGYVPGGTSKPFPATLCVSVNDTVVHGLPGEYVIQDGDLVKLDLGLIHKGFYLDAAVTVPAGEISPEAKKLVWTTREALGKGIKRAIVGNTVGDIGAEIQAFVEAEGFSVVRSLSGHGIGRHLHEDPMVFNFGTQREGEVLQEGMAIAIEPMVAMKKARTKQLEDDSFATADGSLAAHFEHTVAITPYGPRVLTL